MMKKLGLLALSATALLAQDIYAVFNVEPIQEATVSFTSGGIVKEIKAEIGDNVKRDSVLAVIDNEEQLATLKLAQNDLLTAKLQAEQANKSFDRYAKIKDIVDEEKYDSVYFTKEMMQVAVQKSTRNVQLRQAQYDKTFLKAPFDGVITEKYKEVGDAVSGAQPQAFYHIMDTSKIKLVVEFDEKYFSNVQLGDTFEYKVDGMEKTLHGTIAKIYPTADTKSRKIKAEVYTTGLMPGLFGHGTIKAE